MIIPFSVFGHKNSNMMNLVVYIRRGSGWEVCILWDWLQPDHVLDWAAGAINSHCSWEHQHLDRNCIVASAFRSFRSWFLSRALPHHYYCFLHIHSGAYLSLSPLVLFKHPLSKVGEKLASCKDLIAAQVHRHFFSNNSWSNP